MAYSGGNAMGALKLGTLFPDLQQAFVLYDTGYTYEEFQELPARMRKILPLIALSERVVRRSRMF